MTTRTAPLRFVPDTNVLVSALALQSQGFPWLRRGWQAGKIRPLMSRETREELIRVLSYPKFAMCSKDQEELLKDDLPFCEIVTIPNPPPLIPPCRDKFDRPFLELALAGRADVLVTGDQDILRLESMFSVTILSPTDFKKQLESVD